MNPLIEAMAGIFTAAAASGGPLARPARFALETVDWAGKLSEPAPQSYPVVDHHLETACATAGPQGSAAHQASRALSAASGRINWFAYPEERWTAPDLAAFMPNFAATVIIGEGGLLPADKISAGFSLQGPDTYYPPHAHLAEESYWIIGGDGDWKVDMKPWFAVRPGDSVYHKSCARHAMQTNEAPLLTVWLWTSHLHSEVVFVRSGPFVPPAELSAR